MMLVDTGPLVALFDPQDRQHHRCVRTLKGIREPVATTIPVLTEAFHMLGAASTGSDRLRDFIEGGGLSVWFFERPALTRAFELMEVYADHPMDLADASLVLLAEENSEGRIVSTDERDFHAYRWKNQHPFRNLLLAQG